MQRQIMIRRPLNNGASTQMVQATVLSQRGDIMRVVCRGDRRPIEVRASEVVDAAPVFSNNQLAQQRGVVIAKQYPDNSSALCNLQAGFPRMKHGDGAGRHKFIKGRFQIDTCAICGKGRGAAAHKED